MIEPRPFQICSRCILDTKDYPEIIFDEQGVCNICHTFDDLKRRTVFSGEEGKLKLELLQAELQNSRKNNIYDCVLAVSGGADSLYLAHLCKAWGLNPIVLHIDNGWNSELSVKNIENVIRHLGFDLYTYVIDWQELRDLQLAYFKAGVVDLDIPSENALMAAFYLTAKKFKVKHILTGHNTMTEGWLPPNFVSQYKLDTRNLRAIQKQFGTIKLKKYPSIGFVRHFYNSRIKGIKFINPLNLIDYRKEEAKKLLEKDYGWRDYGSKHFENIFTRFYQGYILPVKFGVDKRKSHYSTLICSGQMKREEALELVKHPPYHDQQLMEEDQRFLLKKLGMSEDDFAVFMKQPIRSHDDFPSYLHLYRSLRPVIKLVRKFVPSGSQKDKSNK
ncbi:MAG: N-acetyl sugar amidotransferase [Chitinophagales bacterium]|nr:N-acetyl sugar amidotransferase [Chitinophagales bacterium]